MRGFGMNPRDRKPDENEEEPIPDTEPSPNLPDLDGDTEQNPLLDRFKKGDVTVEEDDGEYD
jgi:hypothetical protein